MVMAGTSFAQGRRELKSVVYTYGGASCNIAIDSSTTARQASSLVRTSNYYLTVFYHMGTISILGCSQIKIGNGNTNHC